MKKKIIIAVLVIFFGFFVGISLSSSKFLSHKIHAELKSHCPNCELKIKELKISWLASKVTLVGVVFKDDPNSQPVVNFSLDHAKFVFNPLSFLKSVPTIKLLDVMGLNVKIIETDKETLPSGPAFPPPGAALKPLPPSRVNEIRIHQSELTYEHLTQGKRAKINIKKINGRIGPFATRENLLIKGYDHPLTMDVTALVENSGIAKVQVSFDPFAKKNHDKITISVQKQDLSQVNHFFVTEEGINVSGFLEDGVAVMSLQQGKLSGKLMATYQDLDLKFNSTGDRSSIESFITNAMSSIRVSKNRPRKDEKNLPSAEIIAVRKPHEPITKLLIRGLSEATQKILTS